MQQIHDPFSFAQILGYIAFLLYVVAFFQRRDIALKLLMALANWVIVVHLYLLGDPAGSAIKVLSALRDMGSATKFRKKLFWPMLIAYGALAPWMVDSSVAIYGYAGGIVALFVTYFLSGVALRIGLLFSTSLWLIYSLLVVSYGGIMQQSFLLFMLALAIFRLSRKASV